MCSPYAGGRGRWVLFAGGVRSAGDDSLRATLYAGGDAVYALRTLEAMEWVLFAGGVRRAGGDSLCATLYAGGDAPCALGMLEAVEGRLCLLEVLEVPEAIRCVLLCMLEVLDVPEVMRCVLLYAGGRGTRNLFAGGAGGDVLCSTLFAGDVEGAGDAGGLRALLTKTKESKKKKRAQQGKCVDNYHNLEKQFSKLEALM